MRANKSWLWALFCSILLFWSCAEPDPMLDEEALLSADLTLLSDDLKVSDLLMEGAPEEFQAAVGRIINHPWGKKVCQYIAKPKPFIHFEAYLDENGEIVRTPLMLLYAGQGRILYTFAALTSDNNDDLLFHEFFHMYQTNEVVITSRNNEVEAYVAQYLYAKSQNRTPWIINGRFTEIIQRLASYINIYTGYFNSGFDLEQFKKDYDAALEFLREISIYNGEGWFENKDMDYTNPFPKLMSLMRN